ncbi:hypothetical protein E4U32_003130 [Claviceps aff. humidiphila group G2b]|nr:hypothetical protein E4U32_003130 [Claviceps aff. humidiphila group G2b]KAG6089401.1 hypothetical protein E4U15_003034 [Claviceps sp. LM218 group G6]
MLIKGTSINSTVSGRSPVEIVKAVNTALKSEVAVAARRLQSGDTVKTFRDSLSQIAFGPDAAVNRRVFSVVVKGFPVRLSENQDREDIRKKLAAANGPSSVFGRDDESRNVMTVSPLWRCRAATVTSDLIAVFTALTISTGLRPETVLLMLAPFIISILTSLIWV